MLSSSAAESRTCSAALRLAFSHWLPPSLCSGASSGDAVLYVPVSQLQLISRYTGMSPEDAPLHKLGGNQWEKAKRKAAEQVRDSAA